MPITTPIQTNYLYLVEWASSIERWSNIGEDQTHDGETWREVLVEHTPPRFSSEPQDSEIDLTLHESNPLGVLFTFGPPPFQIKLRIYEYDRVNDISTPHYKGWIVRPSYDLEGNIVSFRCKTVWHFYERESFTESLSALSRYTIFDPRSGVDYEQFRVGITATEFNDLRDVIKVTGITEPDGHFDGGVIIAPDRDMRTILKHETIGPDKFLTLSSGFPRFTLDVGFTADIYPGDDRTYDTWANKFGSATNNGEKHGGWPYMPNVDPEVRGVI